MTDHGDSDHHHTQDSGDGNPAPIAPPPYVSMVGDHNPGGHKPLSTKESLQNDDFWTVRELLWGILIIVIAIIVLIVVGYLISYHLPQEKPK
ncbi:hypothetical protein Zmor_022226 [Zophobas morio]|uniref:Uncharacterized protein n=1 Tax=Zophobas morio TaxID=2755281 RepID=A0AA38HXB7_9CUCU|nr:hypothetical protein Zmor_022226 [Zophobas morio]